MTYEYPVDLQALWGERAPAFVNLGVPKSDVDRLIEVVDDMWADRPGGWCFEWSKVAAKFADAGQPWPAAAAYGGARFPCLADQAKTRAHLHQIEQYTRAARDFPVEFERRIVTTRLGGEVIEVPVHILSAPDATSSTPVLVATGGIDTWKMDLHPMWVAYALHSHVRVVACDLPGTGELTGVTMTPETTQIIDQVVSFARTLTSGKVGQLGMSFGGYFAAHAGLTRAVDAAVVVGGPVSSAFSPENVSGLLYGMKDIFGNAAGFTSVPSLEQLLPVSAAFRAGLADLLAVGQNSPMFVINGDQDSHVPLADTTMFSGRPDTDVMIIPGGTHCGFNKLGDVIAASSAWLSRTLHQPKADSEAEAS